MGLSIRGMLFENRQDAGKQLSIALNQYVHQSDVVVLAIPRGGVPVALEVSAALALPINLLYIKKIGLPGNDEFAIGAVSADASFVSPEYVHLASEIYIGETVAQKQHEIKEKMRILAPYLAPYDITDKTVLLVDDGIATGRTMLLGLTMLKRQGAKKIVVAVPVAPKDTVGLLRTKADEVICLHEADDFGSVGQHYRDFSQVEDDTVLEMLKASHLAH